MSGRRQSTATRISYADVLREAADHIAETHGVADEDKLRQRCSHPDCHYTRLPCDWMATGELISQLAAALREAAEGKAEAEARLATIRERLGPLAAPLAEAEKAIDRLLWCAYRVQGADLVNAQARRENLDAARSNLVSLFRAAEADTRRLDWLDRTIEDGGMLRMLSCGDEMRFCQVIYHWVDVVNYPPAVGRARAAIDAAIQPEAGK